MLKHAATIALVASLLLNLVLEVRHAGLVGVQDRAREGARTSLATVEQQLAQAVTYQPIIPVPHVSTPLLELERAVAYLHALGTPPPEVGEVLHHLRALIAHGTRPLTPEETEKLRGALELVRKARAATGAR